MSKSSSDENVLALEGFTEPDDQGLSLDELSQAYAAVLAKGADPYETPGGGNSAAAAALADTEQEPSPAAADDADAGFEITPRGILEAILFVGHPTGEPLTSERIAALMRGVQPAEIDDLVDDLNAEYQSAGAPYSILSVGPGYQLALRPQFASLRDAFFGRIREAHLSQAVIDILAIVAYHQPITADEVDRLRGKSSGQLLAQLVRRDLVALSRPTEKNAKPVYHTTDRFLGLFGLANISELPRSQEVGRDLP